MKGAGLSRSAPMARSSVPMARSPMRPSSAPLARVAMAHSAVPIRRRRRAQTPITKSARDEQCTLRFYVCRNDISTTVWCHSNRLADGKGLGIKANDQAGCYGCSLCHAYLDGGWAADPLMTYDTVQERFEQARQESRTKLETKGLIPA